jgi:3-hydroxyisobutyrate dehydrogenase
VTRIAFLGTGLLGSAFVEAALRRGESVTVWNRTTTKARALEPLGATVASTPSDAVRGAERVHLVLRDDASVEEVVTSFREALAPGTIVVDHTTTVPAATAARATRLNAEGVRYLHCPVFIGPAAARKERGTILASGPRALFEAVQPALARQAARVEYLGERPDLAAVWKLCGNAVIIGLAAVVADVLTIARGAGVPGPEAMRVTALLDIPGMLEGRGRNMSAANFTPSFQLAMARKDVQLMLDTAGEAPLAMLSGLAARMDELIVGGYGDADLAVLARDAVR